MNSKGKGEREYKRVSVVSLISTKSPNSSSRANDGLNRMLLLAFRGETKEKEESRGIFGRFGKEMGNEVEGNGGDTLVKHM